MSILGRRCWLVRKSSKDVWFKFTLSDDIPSLLQLGVRTAVRVRVRIQSTLTTKFMSSWRRKWLYSSPDTSNARENPLRNRYWHLAHSGFLRSSCMIEKITGTHPIRWDENGWNDASWGPGCGWGFRWGVSAGRRWAWLLVREILSYHIEELNRYCTYLANTLLQTLHK